MRHKRFLPAIEACFLFGSERPVAASLVIVLLTAIATFGLPRLQIDASYDSLINPLDPENLQYEKVIGTFRSDYATLIYIRDARLFTPEKLGEIEKLTRALERLEQVETVQSLYTVANIRDDDGVLDVNPVLARTPRNDTEIALAKERAFGNPFVVGNLLNRDATATVINVIFKPRWDDGKFAEAAFAAVEKLISPLRKSFAEVFQLGPPRTTVTAKTAIKTDMIFIGALSLIVLLATLALFLKTRAASLLPVMTAGLSLYWTLGLLGLIGVPLEIMTAALPALMVVVGSTEDTHLLAAYLAARREGAADSAAAIRFMARKVGLATFLTGTTTTIGFAVGGLTLVELVRNSAIALSLGMALNLAATVIVLPLVLARTGTLFESRRSVRPHDGRLIDAVGKSALALSSRFGRAITWSAIPATLACLAFASQLRPTNDPMSLLHPDHPLIVAAQTLHRDMAGLQLFYVVIDGKVPGAFKNPEKLKRLSRIEAVIDESGYFDKSLSLADQVAFVNREMNEGRPEMAVIPDDPNLIAQYLILFSRDDLRSFVSTDFRLANILVRSNLFNSAELNEKIADMTRSIADVAGDDMNVHITGKSILLSRASETLVYGMAASFVVLIVLVGALLGVAYWSMRIALLSMIPNILPASSTLALMYLLDIPLNVGTALAAVVALGIAVDDTIHLISAYRRSLADGASSTSAAATAIQAEVLPVTATSFSLVACFLTLALSEFAAVGQFGILCALAIALALPCDLVLTPALLRNSVADQRNET